MGRVSVSSTCWQKEGGNEQLEPHEQAELAPLHSQPDMVIVCGLLGSNLGGW